MRAKIVGALLCVGFLICAGMALVLSTRPGNAQAASKCGDGNEIRKGLKDKYQEEEISIGLVSDQAYFSIFVSPGGATWTLLVTRTDGVSCFIEDGKDWMQGEVPPAGDPA